MTGPSLYDVVTAIMQFHSGMQVQSNFVILEVHEIRVIPNATKVEQRIK